MYRTVNRLIGVYQKQLDTAYQKDFEDPRKQQLKVFERIRKLTQGCESARIAGLEGVSSYADFRKQGRVTLYQDYAELVHQIIHVENKTGLFTNTPIECMGMTSGTTDTEKLIPFQQAYRNEYMLTTNAWYGCIRKRRPNALKGKVFYSVLPKFRGEAYHTGLRRITMGGYNFRNIPRPMQKALYACPKEVLETITDKSRLMPVLLAQVFSSNVTLYADLLPQGCMNFFMDLFTYGDEVLYYLKNGKPSFTVPKALEPVLHLKPDRRALDRVHQVLKEGAITDLSDLLPGIDTIIVWKGSYAGIFLDRLKQIIPPKVQIWDGLYSATEGWFNYTNDPDRAGGPVAIKSHFLEFRDAEDESADILPVWELEDQNKYEVFVTNSAGLIRYRMKDVVKVDGFERNTPRICFDDKYGDYLTFQWERVTASQIELLVDKLIAVLGLDFRRFSYYGMGIYPEHDLPFFVLFLETDYQPTDFSGFDAHQELGDMTFMYQESIDYKLIDKMRLCLVPKGTYQREIVKKENLNMTQVKYNRIVRDPVFIQKWVKHAFIGE